MEELNWTDCPHCNQTQTVKNGGCTNCGWRKTGKETTIINKHIDDSKDSIELSTPSKGGAIKVYWDFSDTEGFKEKIRRAIEVRKYAQELMGEQ